MRHSGQGQARSINKSKEWKEKRKDRHENIDVVFILIYLYFCFVVISILIVIITSTTMLLLLLSLQLFFVSFLSLSSSSTVSFLSLLSSIFIIIINGYGRRIRENTSYHLRHTSSLPAITRNITINISIAGTPTPIQLHSLYGSRSVQTHFPLTHSNFSQHSHLSSFQLCPELRTKSRLKCCLCP